MEDQDPRPESLRSTVNGSNAVCANTIGTILYYTIHLLQQNFVQSVKVLVYLHPPLKMWRADKEGKPRLPISDPKTVPYQHLWGSVKVDEGKKNLDKEVARAEESSKKRNYIKNGISKFIECWRAV